MFLLFQLLVSRNLIWGLIIGYFIVYSGNGMVFNILTSQILPTFIDKTCSFSQFSDINCHYSSFPAPACKKSRLGFTNSLLENFY